ncbi:unnamed protein product [Prunus armeniaca]
MQIPVISGRSSGMVIGRRFGVFRSPENYSMHPPAVATRHGASAGVKARCYPGSIGSDCWIEPKFAYVAHGHRPTRRKDLQEVQLARTRTCLIVAPRVPMVPGLVWSEDADQANQGPLNPVRIMAQVDLVSPRPTRTCHQW